MKLGKKTEYLVNKSDSIFIVPGEGYEGVLFDSGLSWLKINSFIFVENCVKNQIWGYIF